MNNIVHVIVLFVCFVLLPKVGYVWNGDIVGHFAYSFCHANIFHLLCNCFVILTLKQRIRIEVYLIAIICSYIPCWCDVTMGASGVIFAHIGYTWGKICKLKDMCVKNILFLVVSSLLPNVNIMIHIYCMFAGYLYGRLKKGGGYAVC